jgi:hypothetical protein
MFIKNVLLFADVVFSSREKAILKGYHINKYILSMTRKISKF